MSVLLDFHTASTLSGSLRSPPSRSGEGFWCGVAVFSFRRLLHDGKDFRLLPPSSGRRCPEGAEVGSRSGMKGNGGSPSLVSSSRAQPRDLSCRQENGTYEEVRHSKSFGVRCLSLPSLLLSDRCTRKISRFARNDDMGKAWGTGGCPSVSLPSISSPNTRPLSRPRPCRERS